MTPGPPVDRPYSKRLGYELCQDRTRTCYMRTTYVVIPVIILYESMSASSVTAVFARLCYSCPIGSTTLASRIMHDAMQQERDGPMALVLLPTRSGRKKMKTYNDGEGYTKIMQQRPIARELLLIAQFGKPVFISHGHARDGMLSGSVVHLIRSKGPERLSIRRMQYADRWG